MKVRYIYIALVALLGGIFWGCSDWTEVESKDFSIHPQIVIMKLCVSIKK